MAAGQLALDQVGFNIIQPDGDYSPRLDLGAVMASVAPVGTLPPEETDPVPDPTDEVAIIDIDNHSDGDVFEEGRFARFTIERRGSLEGDVVLAWRVFGIGSNPADSNDFVATSGTFTMRDGYDEQTLNITLADDSIFEQDERFRIDLDIISGNAEFSDDDEQATILNDDVLPPWGSGTDDHGDSLGNATFVSGASWAQGFIEAPGDVDWFRFDLRGSGSYLIKAFGRDDTVYITGDSSYNAPALVEAEAILYRSDGSVIARLTEPDGNISWTNAHDSFQLDLQGLPDQTVYLSVRENGDNDVGQYFVRAEVSVEPDDFSADTSTKATLSLNDPFLASHERTGDSDWFRIELVAGTTYRFMAFHEVRSAWPYSELSGSNGYYHFGLYDPRLSIYSSSGAELVATNPDAAPESSNLLQFTPPVSGSYFFAVDSVDTQGAMYDYVSLVQEVSEAPAGVPIVLQPGPTEGVDASFSFWWPDQTGTDDQWLRVNGPDTSALKFDLAGMPIVASYAAIEIFLADVLDSQGESADIIVDVPIGSWDETSSFSSLTGLEFYTAIPQPAVGQWLTIEITDLYNQWQSGELANNGIVLSDGEVTDNYLSRFFSSDYLDNPSLRPKLVIHGPGIGAEVSGTFTAEMNEDDRSISGAIGITSPYLPDVSFAEAAALGRYGTIAVNAAGDTWTYTPFASVQTLDAGDTVQETLTITASNGLAQQISITLRGADDPTAFVGTTNVPVTTSAGIGNGGLSLFDIDGDDKPVFLARSYEGSRGTLVFETTGDWTYTVHEARLSGLARGDTVQDTFDVAHSLGSDTLTINLLVDTEVNTVPVADAESLKVAEGGTLMVAATTLLDGDTDADGDALAIVGVSNAVNGTVSLDDKGDAEPTNDEVIFTPTPGYSGSASFDYRITDGLGGEAFSTVSVTVFNRYDGSNGNDTLSGTSGPDELYGLAGSDVIDGGRGADGIFGNDGFDILIGDGQGLLHIEPSDQIFRLYDTAFNRGPDLNGHQSWVLTLLSGREALPQVAGNFIASREFQNTFGGTTDAQFVTLLYNNVLNRDPSASERDAWINRLTTDWTRERVVFSFSESPEHKNNTAADLAAFDAQHDITTWADDMFRVYRAVLDRDPDTGGYTGWSEMLADGSRTILKVIEGFMGSLEFSNTYGSTNTEQFLTLLYQNVLNRAPSQTEIDNWTAHINGGQSRAEVVFGFANSVEFIRNTGPGLSAFVQANGPDDMLDPGPGDAVVSGGLWADTFVFTDDGEASTVTVTDLEPWDVLDFTDFGLTQQQVLDAMAQVDDEVVFASGVETITFADTLLSGITQDMILV